MASYSKWLLFLKKILVGLRAFTVQGYTEANVKNGTQFTSASYYTGLTAGEVIDVIVITGDKPVIIKSQYLAIKDSGDVFIDWYKDPTYTGGTDITTCVYNQTDVVPNPTTLELLSCTQTNPAGGDYSPNDATKVTVTAVGTKIQPTLAILGIAGIGGSHNARNVTVGLEQVLAPNSVYLYRKTALAATGAMFSFSTWYEGDTDLPKAEGQI